MKHIVNFSGGVGSWAAAKRVIERQGIKNTILLFADVKMEDEDTYRFLIDCETNLGLTITRIQDGRTPWGVFKDERFLGNSRVDPCSKILKRNLLDDWVRSRFKSDECVQYVGIDWSEINRMEGDGEKQGIRKRFLPYVVEAPMCEKPFIDKCKMLEWLKSEGITPPRLYSYGFPHNNCGGFCIKAGQAQFALLLKTLPDRYAFHEQKEQEMREFLGKDVSIMKDRRGGVRKTLTMKAFRERIQATGEYDKHEWGGCGCAL